VTPIRRITMVLPMHGVFRPIIIGFRTFSARLNWRLDIVGPEYGWQPAGTAANVMQQPADALVVEPTGWAALRPHLEGKLPAVLLLEDQTRDGVASAVVDDDAVGVEAARHLLDRGLTTFGVYGLGGHAFAVARADGFRRTIEAAGHRVTPWDDRTGRLMPTDPIDWYDNCAAWLARMPRGATGIFCGCDGWGVRLSEVLMELGLRAPDDYALVGADNDEFTCERIIPPLSSVVTPWGRLGSEAARLAAGLIDGKPPPRQPVVIAPTHVFTRQSSDTIAVHDPEVAAAMRYIRASVGKRIDVPDVLDRVATNRRTLERRFRALIGRSIMQEVRRVRIEQSKRLLSATDLSIDEVAHLSGFSSPKKLADAFRRATGATPSGYRLKHQLRG
jgi:LacI family transcriptional regulator